MEVKDRLRMIMESHKLNAGSFADKIGVQRSNVSHVLSGRNKPSFDFIEKLLHAFPRVSAEWLFTGKQEERRGGVSDFLIDAEPVKLSDAPMEKSNHTVSGKRIVKTLVFYEDFTFDVFLPNEK